VTSHGPLAGVRIVELAGLGPAPFCAMLLADLGADVVVVRRPGERGNGLLDRGKRHVTVDLKHQDGPAVVLAMVERADALVEGFRPGVVERLGVGPEQCWTVNPRLVYGRMTGWGQDGPLAGQAGHDIDYIALTGMLHAIGRAGGPPQVPVNLLGDFGGGALYLAVGVLAAVLEARGSGRGQVVDASIVDGVAHLGTLLFGMMAAGRWQTERGTNLLDTGAPFYDVYQTSDGGFVAVGALEPQFYEELLCRLDLAAEMPDREDPRNWPEIREKLAAAFARRTRQEWAEHFADSDACVAPVLSMTEAAGHPQVVARETLLRSGGVLQPAPAPRFSRTPNPAPGRAAASTLWDDWQITGRPGESGAVREES
jgi:alpha-methylacyl-CoA racemase